MTHEPSAESPLRNIREVTGPIRFQSDNDMEFRPDVLTLLDYWTAYLKTVPGSVRASQTMQQLKEYYDRRP